MKPTYHDLSNPITAAVLPLKEQAKGRAEAEAKALIKRVHEALEANGWDADKAAPRGDTNRDGRNEFRQKMAKHNLFCQVTTYDPTQTYRRFSDPTLRVKSEENEKKFIADSIEQAGAQYDSFVSKLVAKVGKVTEAKLHGSHVWGFSDLSVRKPDGTVEVWRTQQIVNQSVLGTLFNQWPTRKLGKRDK